jgi:hypothetical protein
MLRLPLGRIDHDKKIKSMIHQASLGIPAGPPDEAGSTGGVVMLFGIGTGPRAQGKPEPGEMEMPGKTGKMTNHEATRKDCAASPTTSPAPSSGSTRRTTHPRMTERTGRTDEVFPELPRPLLRNRPEADGSFDALEDPPGSPSGTGRSAISGWNGWNAWNDRCVRCFRSCFY